MEGGKTGDLHLVYYLWDGSINTRGDEGERREREKKSESEQRERSENDGWKNKQEREQKRASKRASERVG